MDSYEALIDDPLTGNSASIADFQVPSSYSQFANDGSINNSYGNLSGLPGGFPNAQGTPGGGLNISGYNTPNAQQASYGNMPGSSPSFSMPYDPPSMQQSSTPMQMAAPPSAPPSQPTSNKTIHSCTYCGLVLSSANALMEHKRIHTGDRPFSCNVCNKRFTQKAHLNIHKRTHTGEKPYACHICHKRFAQSSHLSSHKRIHTGEKPFVCGICHVGFTQKQRLDAHHKKHLGQGQEQIPRPMPAMGTRAQIEQFTPVPPNNDDNTFMQMIGHGMPYIKQEAGLIGDTNNANLNSNNNNGINGSIGSSGDRNRNHRTRGHDQVGNNGGIERTQSNKKDGLGSDEEEDDNGSTADSDKSPKISAPSFSSEGMFLHPSGYVAYGGIEDGEESNDQSPGSGATESPGQQQGSGAPNAGHRRKPSVVRKRYSESPVKEPGGPVSNTGNGSDFQRFTPLHGRVGSNNDNSDESGVEDFHDTGEVLDDKNDPPYNGSSSNKSKNPGVLTRHAAPQVNQSVVETRSHSRRNTSQAMNRTHPELMNGDKINFGTTQHGNLSYSGHNNSVSNSGLVKVNNRISLVNFTAEELVTHLMKRDDVHKCQFCCLIFQDAAMYHIHRNMHDKSDVRKCNMCGKLLQDKYDFTAHFLSMHQS